MLNMNTNGLLLAGITLVASVVLSLVPQTVNAQAVRDFADDFAVDGSAHRVGDQLVGSMTPTGKATWRSSRAYANSSFVLTQAADMIVEGRVKIPDGQSATANGVDIPPVAIGEELVVEYEVTLNDAAFAAIVVSADWDKFWDDASLLIAQVEKNGNVHLTYPGGKVSLTGKTRPWWLLKNQPMLLRLAYNTQNNTVGFAIRGISNNPARPGTILVARDITVPETLRQKLATAGMFVNGSSASLDNFRMTLGPAGKNPLGMPEAVMPSQQKTQSEQTTPHATDKPDGTIRITVGPQTRQVFEGFGASIMGGGDFLNMTADEHDQLAKLIWNDLHFNTIRLWFYTWHFRENRMPGYLDFQQRYVNNQVLAKAGQAGMNTIYLCGDNFPPQWTTKDDSGHTIIDQQYLAQYAAILANLVDKARNEDHISIGYVGLQNEPGAHDPFRPEDFPPVVKHLRQALDQRNLKDVKIVAPEMADAGTSFFRVIELMQADPQAWEALDVISVHSYGIGSNPRLAQLIEQTDKKLWMTESSNAPPDDSRAASVSAGMCLNDLNHMASRWLWFIGYGRNNTRHDMNGPLLISFKTKPFAYERLLKYYYFQALSQTFDIGATFRKPQSSLDGPMLWKGKTVQPPHVTVSAARNPDGTWALALLNYTAGSDTPPAVNPEWQWPRHPGHPQQTFNVNVVIDELAQIDSLAFHVHRTNANSKNQAGQSVVMKNGNVSVTVHPMELVVLRSE
jgi:O-glycosyl hydrolase